MSFPFSNFDSFPLGQRSLKIMPVFPHQWTIWAACLRFTVPSFSFLLIFSSILGELGEEESALKYENLMREMKPRGDQPGPAEVPLIRYFSSFTTLKLSCSCLFSLFRDLTSVRTICTHSTSLWELTPFIWTSASIGSISSFLLFTSLPISSLSSPLSPHISPHSFRTKPNRREGDPVEDASEIERKLNSAFLEISIDNPVEGDGACLFPSFCFLCHISLLAPIKYTYKMTKPTEMMTFDELPNYVPGKWYLSFC